MPDGRVLAVLLVLPVTVALAASLPLERRDSLMNLLKQDCGSCHGLTMKGGLGPSLLPEDLRDRSEEDLVDIVLDGVPGTPMPPWRSELRQEEAMWLVRQLKSGLPQ